MISLHSQRVFFSDNGTLTDISKKVNNHVNNASAVTAYTASQDYIYIGAPLPFTSRYFKLSTVNDQASIVSVEIWDGDTWEAAVDVIDDTELAGVSFGKKGIIQWTTDKDKSWGIESTTEDVTVLNTLKIYNMYWARIKFDATFNVLTAIQYVGWKFSDDSDFEVHYADLNRQPLRTAYKDSNKTDWDDQHVAAAELLISDLIKKRYATTGDQIFNYEQFNIASIHKAASLIYRQMGDDYLDQKLEAEKLYNYHLHQGITVVDRDQDGHKDVTENQARNIGLTRV